MPAASDILQFMRGQLFEEPSIPRGTSFSGRTIVITGANTGLGLQCAKQVAALGASRIIMGCRNLSKGEAARSEIVKSISASQTKLTVDIEVWQIDMASYPSVQDFAKRLTELGRVDVVLANAGISVDQFALAEGLESTLTVNVVSTFLLAALALPALKATAAKIGRATHLTIVGSNVHAFADHTQLQSAPAGQVFSSLSKSESADMAARYFVSKLVVMQSARELAATVRPSEVIVNCPSPGWCKTELFRTDDGGFWGRNMLKLIGRTAESGAKCLTSAIVTGPESHGQYLSECRVKKTSVFVRSSDGQILQRQLWDELALLLASIAPETESALRSKVA